MDHPGSGEFSLTSIPTALGPAITCDARARDVAPPDPLPLEYGELFGMTVRFRTGGDAAVLRALWRKEQGAWKITSYGVEVP